MKKQFIFGFLMPIILGGLIYIGFRSENLVMFSWFKTLHINGTTTSFRAFLKGMDTVVPKWVVFSLPGGLYMISCVSLIMLLWRNRFNRTSIFWIFLVPVLGILSEPLQYYGLLPGTHHFGDYIMYIIGTMIPVILFRNIKIEPVKTEDVSWKIYTFSSFVTLFYFVLAYGADVVGSPLGNLVESLVGPCWAGSV